MEDRRKVPVKGIIIIDKSSTDWIDDFDRKRSLAFNLRGKIADFFYLSGPAIECNASRFLK